MRSRNARVAVPVIAELRTDLDLAANLPIGVIGHAHPARLGNALEPGGDIDAITENIVVIDNDVTDVDADTELDPSIFGTISAALGHDALDFYSAAHRIDCAGKLD